MSNLPSELKLAKAVVIILLVVLRRVPSRLQNLRVLSLLTAINISPLELKARLRILAGLLMVLSSLPSSFQSLIMPSSLAEAMVWPSGLNLTIVTLDSCP